MQHRAGGLEPVPGILDMLSEFLGGKVLGLVVAKHDLVDSISPLWINIIGLVGKRHNPLDWEVIKLALMIIPRLLRNFNGIVIKMILFLKEKGISVEKRAAFVVRHVRIFLYLGQRCLRHHRLRQMARGIRWVGWRVLLVLWLRLWLQLLTEA